MRLGQSVMRLPLLLRADSGHRHSLTLSFKKPVNSLSLNEELSLFFPLSPSPDLMSNDVEKSSSRMAELTSRVIW